MVTQSLYVQTLAAVTHELSPFSKPLYSRLIPEDCLLDKEVFAKWKTHHLQGPQNTVYRFAL